MDVDHYENGLYLSQDVLLRIKEIVQECAMSHYKYPLEFFSQYVEKWKLESAMFKNRQILKVWHVEEDATKVLRIEYHYRDIQIYVHNIPVLRSYNWDDLLAKASLFFEFPNQYLKLNDPVVKAVIASLNPPHESVVYKGITSFCKPEHVDHHLYETLLSACKLPTWETLLEDGDVSFTDHYNYVRKVGASG